MKRFAFYADTPYQLLNCINYVLHDVEGSRGEGDLYLLYDNEEYPNAVQRLKESNLFRNIYIVSKQKETNWMVRYIRRAWELLFPAVLMKNCCRSGMAQKDDYDVIVFSTICPLTIAMVDLNKKAKVWMYDDGLGCYVGNWLNHFESYKTHLLYKLFGKGAESVVPERLYVNNLEFCRTTMDVQLIQLPILKDEECSLELLQDVFYNDSRCADLNKKYIFLSQPFDETMPPSSLRKLDLIFDYLQEHYGKDTIVRKHPREKKQDYRGLNIASSRPMWELFCVSSLREDQALIGFFSTAQLTPKILFAKEPSLIFLYRLVPMKISEEREKEIDNFVQCARQSYRNKEKIHVPRTMQEFVESLRL